MARSIEPDCVEPLRKLVESGEGFVVAHTPEYIEGTAHQVSPSVSNRLHRGDFSIQAHIDLHGLTVKEARPTLDAFLHDAVATGKRTVLIIHGRGLSSPNEPVLKAHVAIWLSQNPWRKWVIAYATARLCDGGAGATSVLLRERPTACRRGSTAG